MSVISDGDTDVEDRSIQMALAGLVSRLRRRGAVRIEPGADIGQFNRENLIRGGSSSGVSAALSVSSLADSFHDRALASGSALHSSIIVDHRDSDSTSSVGGYRLICGALILPSPADPAPSSDDRPQPSPLPLFPPLPVPSSTRNIEQQSTGCGAEIHISASPSEKTSTWVARGLATRDVVPLEECYFERTARRDDGRKERRLCGCTWEGVGCRICGAPLGRMHLPCRKHSPCIPVKPLFTFNPLYITSIPSYDFPFPLPNRPLTPSTAAEASLRLLRVFTAHMSANSSRSASASASTTESEDPWHVPLRDKTPSSFDPDGADEDSDSELEWVQAWSDDLSARRVLH